LRKNIANNHRSKNDKRIEKEVVCILANEISVKYPHTGTSFSFKDDDGIIYFWETKAREVEFRYLENQRYLVRMTIDQKTEYKDGSFSYIVKKVFKVGEINTEIK
jgi:hypothetical protein